MSIGEPILCFVLFLIGSFVMLSSVFKFYDSWRNNGKYGRVVFLLYFMLVVAFITGIDYRLQSYYIVNEQNKETIKNYENSLQKEREIIEKYKNLSQEGMINLYIDKVCTELKLNKKLVKALIFVESGYNTKAVGKYGEIGLMQIKLSTAQMFNPDLTKMDLYDWHKNIYYGCLYLHMQIKTHGFKRGILSYNGGAGILKYKINGKYVNEKYYKKILTIYKSM